MKGFSLIEMMTALGVGSVLLAGLFGIFSTMSDSYRTDFALAEIQDNGRFAYRFIEFDLRTAGYQGCIDTEKATTDVLANDAPTGNITADAILGYEVGSLNWTPTAPSSLSALDGVAKAGSDVFTVQFASDDSQALTATMGSAADVLTVADNSLDLAVDDLVLITDCSSADLFQVSSINTSGAPVTISHGATKNSSASLGKSYSTGSTIRRYIANTYYVADNGQTNTAGNPVFSLFRQDVYGNSAEIVEGVNSMQVLYGEEVATGLLRYVAASSAGLDMANVRSMRIGLLMQSTNDARTEDDDVIYNLPGDTVSPAGTAGASQTYIVDSTLKQVFSQTILLRNRL